MARNKVVLILTVLMLSSGAFAQDRYMVFFSDKDNVPYSIESPEQFLSTRAIERRDRMNIPITEDDLPVDAGYVNQINATGAQVFFYK
jgi:hypothetical protein